jgi:hypothetical protein
MSGRTAPLARSVRTKSAEVRRRKPLRSKALTPRMRPSERARTAYPTTPDGTVIPPIRVGRLRTVADWHKQVAKVYRAMRKGYLPKEDGTRLTYVANIGAQLAKYKDEMREIERIREQLEALKAGAPQALLTARLDDATALEPAP